jgi:hypothetical protein
MSGFPEKIQSAFVHPAIALIGIDPERIKKIPLTRGKVALVDADDYQRLIVHKWYAVKGRYTFYAVRGAWKNKKMIRISMHREILGLNKGDGKISDHKDRDGLNNRKYNLRIVNYHLNAWNRKTRNDNASGFRGVSWHKQRKKWQVRISRDGIRIYCGIYPNLEEAAMVYDKKSIDIWGKDAILNFPENRREYEQLIRNLQR